MTNNSHNGYNTHQVLPPPSNPPPTFVAVDNNNINSKSINIDIQSDNNNNAGLQQQMQVRTLLNSRKERQRLQDLKSAYPHPTKRTNDGGREEKQLTEKMYVKNKQRHISMHEYMSNKKKNSKTKTSKKNVVSNRNKRRR